MLEYINVDQHLHLLCQIQARVAANLISEKEDYSHTNLAFDPIGKRMTTRWMNIENDNLCLAINLQRFSFEWLNPTLKTVHEIFISGKTYGQLHTEITESLKVIGLKSNNLSIKLAYEIEQYPFSDQSFETFDENVLNSWINHRTAANQSCEALLKYLNAIQEVRIWPHHFDTGIYVEIDHMVGIGFGLAMKDAMVGSPYFYISGYGLQHEILMNNLPELTLGSWKKDEWKGAILPLTTIENLTYGERKRNVLSFIKSTTDWYLEN